MNVIPIFQSLFTLGFIAAAGIFSRKLTIFAAQDTKIFSAFVYYFGLPALFIVEIARLDVRTLDPSLIWGSLLPLVIIFSFVLLLRVLRVMSRDVFAILGITTVFGSNAFFGVPFFESLFGPWGVGNAVVTGAILGMFGIVASVILFSYATHQGGVVSLLRHIGQSPLIISVFIGIFFSAVKFEAPVMFKALGLVGQTTSAIAIFVLGMFMYDHFSLVALKKAFAFTLIRVIVLPLVTYLVILMLNTQQADLNRFLLLQSGIPAAISIGIMAERFRYKTQELFGIVILSSLSSFMLLFLLYAFAMAAFNHSL